jgi:penicillin-binding protein 1A
MSVKPPPSTAKKPYRGGWLLRFLGWAFSAMVIVSVAVSAVVGWYLWNISKELPDYEVLAQYEPPVVSRVYANNGMMVDEYARERRIYVPIDAVPELLINAFLSAEDKNFFRHSGIDITGIARAVITNLKNAGSQRRLVGASTITQQVAKNFLLTNEQRIERKVKEAILAIRIEHAFSKKEILALYLNEIYFGMHSYGIASASLNYFAKPLHKLSLAEAAYLAALPKAPNNYHPFRKTKAAISRRNWVIDRMYHNGYISKLEAEDAKNTPLVVKPRPFGTNIFAAEFFAEEVRRWVNSEFGETKLYGGGLSIHTTLRPDYQGFAKKALVDGLVAYDRRHGWRGAEAKINIDDNWEENLTKQPYLSDIKPWRQAVVLKVTDQQAIIGLRPEKPQSGKNAEESRENYEKGEIAYSGVRWARPARANGKPGPRPKKISDVLSAGDVIYVNRETNAKTGASEWQLMQVPEVDGGIVVMAPHTGRVLALVGGFSFAGSQFNRATQAKRQPGSAFKPFVYAAALDNGYTPASIVLDAPFSKEMLDGTIWRPQNYGKKFFGPSTLRLGIEKSRNAMTVRLAEDIGMPMIGEYARRFGIYEKLLPVLSMSLGAGETTLLKMTTAYSMLVNGGKQVTATLVDRIQDRHGKVVWKHDKRECVACQATMWEGQKEPELPDAREQVINPYTAYQITSILNGVVTNGTGIRVSKGLPKWSSGLAGKTGTTNDERDAWFIGFSPDLVVGVFIGFDSPAPMGKGETGGAVASPVFLNFMKEVIGNRPAIPFRVPDGIKFVRINRKTGARARSRQAGNSVISEAFKPGNNPPETSWPQVDAIDGTGNSAIPWGVY